MEDKLKLAEECRLKINKTNVPFVIFISLGEWWNDPIRLCLLSAILKDCKDETNIDQLLDKELTGYISKTRKAIRWFLQGNTHYQKEEFLGWVNQLRDEFSDAEIEEALKDKPTREIIKTKYHSSFEWHQQKLCQR